MHLEFPNISDRYKCIYIHIPKCAGSSIKEALNLPGKGHPLWRYYADLQPEKWREYFKFTVVRNPWDRLVSSYSYAGMKASYWHNTRMELHPEHELVKQKPFPEFCAYLEGNLRSLHHESWYPQHHWIAQQNGNRLEIVVDQVLRYENLDEDFSRLMSDLGVVDVSLPHVNKSNRGSYRDFYDARTRQIVANVYAEDIELFGYEF